MVGGTPEIETSVNSVPCRSLIDTGSQITTISESLYNSHFQSIPIQKCSDLLKITGVGGNVLPYKGYIVCDVEIPLTDSSVFSCPIPILVVPNTDYNHNVPVLLGTNFLSKIPSIKVPLSALTPHLRSAISVLQIQTSHLEKSNGVFGSLRACSDVTVSPFTSQFAVGTSVLTIPIRQQIAMVQGFNGSVPVVPGITG